MTTTMDRALRDAIMEQMGRLGRRATGPSAPVLARLTGFPLRQVSDALLELEKQHLVEGRVVKTGGPVCWVPWGNDQP